MSLAASRVLGTNNFNTPIGIGIGVGANKFLGMQRTFARIFPNLPEKLFCDYSQQILSHKDHEDLFWYNLEKVFVCFSANIGHHVFARIFRDFA